MEIGINKKEIFKGNKLTQSCKFVDATIMSYKGWKGRKGWEGRMNEGSGHKSPNGHNS